MVDIGAYADCYLRRTRNSRKDSRLKNVSLPARVSVVDRGGLLRSMSRPEQLVADGIRPGTWAALAPIALRQSQSCACLLDLHVPWTT